MKDTVSSYIVLQLLHENIYNFIVNALYRTMVTFQSLYIDNTIFKTSNLLAGTLSRNC